MRLFRIQVSPALLLDGLVLLSESNISIMGRTNATESWWISAMNAKAQLCQTQATDDTIRYAEMKATEIST